MRKCLLSICSILVLCTTTWAGEVKTIAGSGKVEFSGDGGSALKAGVGGPFGVSLGPDTALYICETTNHVIRRLDDATGILTTVVGTGAKGYAGDNGPAGKALLNEPYEVRFDRSGNMFFVEMRNHIVRRVDSQTGIISTVAGTGEKGFSGDGGPATKATLSVPHSIALDASGNLYICDIGNHRVRKVALKTGIITTFAGTGEKKPTLNGATVSGTPLNGPRAIDFDGKGNLFLALREGNAVYRIDLFGLTLHHIAGTGKKGYSGDGGDARKALLSGPKGIAVGPHGDVYLADTESHTIRVIRKKSGIIETIVGDGQKGDGPDGDPLKCRLARPHGVFVDQAGNVYIGDSSNNRVRKLLVGSTQQVSTQTGDSTEDENWERIELDAAFRSEGVAVADVNRDGNLDVLAGDVWYESPRLRSSLWKKARRNLKEIVSKGNPLLGLTKAGKWKMHAIRTVGNFVAGKGYSNSFCNFAHDINGDGWDDMILIGFPGAPFHWYENPRNQPGHWKEHVIWNSICNESPLFADLTGDGMPEVILGSQPESKMGFLPLPSSAKATEKWDFHAVSRAGDPMKNGTFKYYHGIGVGDFNKDGRSDLLIPHGWWEAPPKSTGNAWEFHPWTLSKDGSGDPLKAANMYVEDLDLDGDNDIIMSSAHEFGVWWFENRSDNGGAKFKYHLIDESYSQTHAMHYVDVNGDGQRDIVTGKRFYAHNGRDPGGKDAVVMYWYEVHRQRGQLPKFIPHEIVAGRDTGIGTQFEVHDMNGDGKIDIVLSNKKGVNVLIQK